MNSGSHASTADVTLKSHSTVAVYSHVSFLPSFSLHKRDISGTFKCNCDAQVFHLTVCRTQAVILVKSFVAGH